MQLTVVSPLLHQFVDCCQMTVWQTCHRKYSNQPDGRASRPSRVPLEQRMPTWCVVHLHIHKKITLKFSIKNVPHPGASANYTRDIDSFEKKSARKNVLKKFTVDDRVCNSPPINQVGSEINDL
jgi:hypothetical protein